MGKIEYRKKELLAMLQMTNSLSVEEVADHFKVSLPTARRLCTQLAQEGRVIRTHGRIKHLPLEKSPYSFERLRNEFVDEKIRIAQYASKLVKNDQVIFIEAGTTLHHFSLALAERLRNQELTNVVIFTNSLVNLNILYPVQSNIMMIGGQYRDDRKDFVGYLSEMALKDLRFNYCFIGADAVTPAGVMAMDIDTVRFDTELSMRADNNVILAHSEKFNRQSLISFVSLENVHCLITDNGLPDDIAQKYYDMGVNLVCV